MQSLNAHAFMSIPVLRNPDRPGGAGASNQKRQLIAIFGRIHVHFTEDWHWTGTLIKNHKYLLCSPELSPQMTGGEELPGLVMENASVLHWVASFTASPSAPTIPLVSLTWLAGVKPVGPSSLKLTKSSLQRGNRKYILGNAIVFFHTPSLASFLTTSKWEKFLLAVPQLTNVFSCIANASSAAASLGAVDLKIGGILYTERKLVR